MPVSPQHGGDGLERAGAVPTEVVAGSVPDGLATGAAAALVEVPAPTLRAWERRYGVPMSPRTLGGHRRFSISDLDQVAMLREEIALGLRAAEAASMVREVGRPSARTGELIARVVWAARAGQPGAVAEVLDVSRLETGLAVTVDDVVMPAVRRLARWCAADERVAATAQISRWLRAILAEAPAPVAPATVLIAGTDPFTADLALAALLSHRGVAIVLAGSAEPTGSLAALVATTTVAAVVVVAETPVRSGRRSALDTLRAGRTVCPEPRLFYAGTVFGGRRARVGMPGTYLGRNLSVVASLIVARLAVEAPWTDRPHPLVARTG
jgi:DNA-binding transcriptional MerR regulator